MPTEITEPEPPPIEITEPEPLLCEPELRRTVHLSAEPQAEPVEPTSPESPIEEPPAIAATHPPPLPEAPLPPIIARAPNPKSLTGGYALREQQFKFRAAMQEITGRRWNGG